jgi:hypothetical protein
MICKTSIVTLLNTQMEIHTTKTRHGKATQNNVANLLPRWAGVSLVFLETSVMTSLPHISTVFLA